MSGNGIGLKWAKKVLTDPNYHKVNSNPNKTKVKVWDAFNEKMVEIEISSDNRGYKPATFKECTERRSPGHGK